MIIHDELLTTFFNKSSVLGDADLGEAIGKIGLGLLSLGFGKTVLVEKIEDSNNKLTFSNKTYHFSIRIAAIALFILARRFTIPLAVVGSIAVMLSKSHQKIFDSYIQSKLTSNFPNSNEINPETKTNETEQTYPQTRTTPPIGICGTSPNPKSIFCEGIFFNDDEIVEKCDLIERKEIGQNENNMKYEINETTGRHEYLPLTIPIYASRTRHNKYIIQQQGQHGCSAAATAMLIMDEGEMPDIEELINRNGGYDSNIRRDFEKVGLSIVKKDMPADLDQLKSLINQCGSVMVILTGSFRHHAIVVDDVSDIGVRLRDPFHGWEITVKADAFLKEWYGKDVIQLVR